MIRSIIAILLLFLPLLEIAGFVFVGGRIGIAYTLLLVVCSVLAGVAILRHQGFQALTRLRQRDLPRDMPAERFFDTAFVLLAGLLLIVPGFVSDAIALLLLVPFVRHILARRLASRVVVVNVDAGAQPRDPGPAKPRTIDLDSDDYRRDEPQ
ncbi:FxsA family protein [Mycoplana sp. MJR14]|uniref:FxsA family protein n=1 Tax=Mycoplana sp. MJR14 TaxID=3032583 RepID=UPI0023DA0927|nr:FxsA family protein [Mycoplana sp. MJR14]MDF1633062.1 FxsA family protein [Mycoplana sp. MJR14]